MIVKTTFLNGELEEEAPKQWHQKFNEVVLSNGYLLNQAKKCVYRKFDESGKGVIIFLYVDDMLIFGTDQVQVDLTKEFLSSMFSMKDMREADVIPVSTPMDTSEKLMPNNAQTVSQLEYYRVIGCLMYAMICTRHDIAFDVVKLSSYSDAWLDPATMKTIRPTWWVFPASGWRSPLSSWDFKKQTCITVSDSSVSNSGLKDSHQGVIYQRKYPQQINSSVSLFSIESSACILFSDYQKFTLVINGKQRAIVITTGKNLVVADKEHTTRCFESCNDRWEYGRCIKKYEGFRVDVKRKSIEDKVCREKVFEVEEALNIENSRASSFQMRGIHVVKTKVNAVWGWSSPKTLPEVRNNKVADAFQEEDELEHVEPLDGEMEQVTYVVQRTLYSPKVSDYSQRNKIFQTKCFVKEKICSIIDGESCENLAFKALVKAFKLPSEPHHSPYQIGRIKKGLTFKVTEERPWKHDMDATYQGVVSPKKKLESKTLATLVASPKYFQAGKEETGSFLCFSCERR
ncbi:zinc finger, CCHC-type containing protein [Tanacetum coccineum]